MNARNTLLLFALVCAFLLNVQAQQPPSAAERLDNLRLQLIEVQGKEEALRARAQQLDEALKPENIERSLAGVGSTRPEELREARRRQLQIERDGVTTQLNALESSRMRLETEIQNAEIQAYHESARPVPSTYQALIAQSVWGHRWLISGGASALVVGFIAGILLHRRLKKRSR